MPYSVGDAVPLIYTLQAAATVSCTVTAPDGSTSSPAVVQSGSPPAVTYSAAFAATQAGAWLARFVATGAVTDTEDQQIMVEAVAAGTLYATVGELRSSLSNNANLDAGQLTAALRAASRAVDNWCQRGVNGTAGQFWLDPTPTVRIYTPNDWWQLRVNDIGSTTGLTIRTDLDGNGVYETTWAATDYQLEPVSGGAGAVTWNRIVAIGSQKFPLVYTTGGYTRASVQVTARHGWSMIPDPIRQATLLLAARYYRRRDVPFGNEAGFGEYGPVPITRRDSDVLSLLAPYSAPPGVA
jgi:hypothetical protein